MNKYDWQNKDKFLKDLNNANNRCNFLIKQNLSPTSGNYATIRRWLNYHNMSSSFDKKKHKLEDPFVENSLYNRSSIRKIILKKNLIPYKCECCGNEGTWNGKPLTLQLEHKNGINNDHRIENLTFLCPNCHAQTPSYGGANNAKNKFTERLPFLLNYKTIKKEHLIILSKEWNQSIDWTKSWLIKNESNLNINNITLDNLNRISKQKLNFTNKTNRLNDLKEILEHSLILETLSKKWDLRKDNVKVWLKRNAPEYYKKIPTKKTQRKQISSLFILKSKIDFSSRFTEVSILTNKKQVLELSKKWDTSVNGAKKWIRNNLPDKFKEIYDDKHLEKNKKKVLQQEKINYIKSLEEDFNEIEAMNFLSISKIALYTQIKVHNPDLLEKLHNKHLCPKCNYKTRSNGQYRRCLSCNHDFKPKIHNVDDV